MLSFITSLSLVAAQPLPSAEEFKQIQQFSRAAAMQPPATPLAPQRHPAAPPVALDGEALQAAARELGNAFFIDAAFSESVTVVGDMFAYPIAAGMGIQVTWKSAPDADGVDRLRPRTAEEIEEAKTFRRGEVRDGEFRDEVPVKGDSGEVVAVHGEAKFEFVATFDRALLRCDAPGTATQVGAWRVTLVACKGSWFNLRVDGIDWQDPFPDGDSFVVSDASG
jgi:hypothetical protein